MGSNADIQKKGAHENVHKSLMAQCICLSLPCGDSADCVVYLRDKEEKEMMRFIYRVQNLLAERNEVLSDLQRGAGVNRKTLYRGPKRKQTIAAIAYYLNMDAKELVSGTDAEEVWNTDTSEY